MAGPEIILFIAILLISVIVHEISHGYMADYLGDPTARLQGRLTLNPVPHIDPVGSVIVPAVLALLPGGIIFGWAKPVPYNPHNIANRWGDTLVAAAGPASNLFLALLAGVAFQLAGGAAGSVFGAVCLAVILINVVLAVFNLVPIPPLDGSKILFDLLPAQYAGVKRNLKQYGFLILLAFLFLGGVELIQPVITNIASIFTGGVNVLTAV